MLDHQKPISTEITFKNLSSAKHRAKSLFHQLLEESGRTGVSKECLSEALSADSSFSWIEPETFNFLLEHVWRTTGKHKVRHGSVRVSQVISFKGPDGKFKKLYSKCAHAAEWESRKQILGEVERTIQTALLTTEVVLSHAK